MLKALNTAATGMKAQQQNMDVIANNMSNASTIGYKKARAEFEDLLYEQMKEPGGATGLNAVSPTGVQTGLGARTAAIQKDFSLGSARITENPLDMQVEGKGFFKLLNEEGEVIYTRNGAFKRSPGGKIVDRNGLVLQPEIEIPSDAVDINISSRGEVAIVRDELSAPEVVGQVELVSFINPAGLRALGRNNFASTAASGDPVNGLPGRGHFGTVSQGQLEASNVNIVEEMVNMIGAQRTYETNSKVIQASDQMLQTLNNLR